LALPDLARRRLDLCFRPLAAGGRVVLFGRRHLVVAAALDAADWVRRWHAAYRYLARIAGGQAAFLAPSKGSEDDPAAGSSSPPAVILSHLIQAAGSLRAPHAVGHRCRCTRP